MVAAPIPWKRSTSGKERLRLWVRMLRITRSIEGELRERFKAQFETTLPRFDVMAALFRAPDGMLMSDLSRFLLVSNGNVTGIIDRLVQDGFVLRAQRAGDRRTSIVRLTAVGVTQFAAMAAAHEAWIGELLAKVRKEDAQHVSAILASFRSDWEG